MPTIDSGICEYEPCSKPFKGFRGMVGKPRRFCSVKCANLWQKQKFAILEVNTQKYPIYTHYLRLRGNWMIVADLHAPFILVEFLKKMLAVAKKHLIKKLVIGGDFFNQGAFSHWQDIGDSTPFEKELRTCEMLLDLLVSWFDEIVILTAGHEKRMLRLLGFKLKPKRLFQMISDRIGREIKVSPYSHCTINNKWKIIHPKRGRKKKLSLSSELATKYHKNIICLHQHYTALGLDTSGKYVVCDLGMMADGRKLSYTQIDVDVWPASSNSFAMIKDNYIAHFTDHPNLTNWVEVLEKK